MHLCMRLTCFAPRAQSVFFLKSIEVILCLQVTMPSAPASEQLPASTAGEPNGRTGDWLADNLHRKVLIGECRQQ